MAINAHSEARACGRTRPSSGATRDNNCRARSISNSISAPNAFGAAALRQIFRADAEALQIFRRQIDAAQFRILPHVAQDVGELKRDAALLGERQRFGDVKPKMWMVVSPTTEATR